MPRSPRGVPRARRDDWRDGVSRPATARSSSHNACAAGASYGGYSTLIGLAKDPDLYRCGVAWLAVTDLELLVNGAWHVDDDIGNDFRKYGMPERVGDRAAMVKHVGAWEGRRNDDRSRSHAAATV